MKPDYLVIGAQKCATSSLCQLLGRHPDVFMTEPKEPYFFSNPEVWSRGWEWYEALFAGAHGCRAIGEGSTTYTQRGLFPEAAGRIARALPDARLIYIARDPIDRIVSHWMHLRSRENQESLPLDEAVRARAEYLDNSDYLGQIEAYRAHFPDERILVLFFEDFRSDPNAVLRRCFEFLGVDPGQEPEDDPEPQHVSSAGRVDGRFMAPLRHVPFFRHLRDAAPSRLRESMRRLFKKPIGNRPEWGEAARRWTMERLRPGTRAFLARYGKPPDHWPWVAEKTVR